MMPLDTVNTNNQLNNPQKIQQQLSKLKSVGVDGYVLYVLCLLSHNYVAYPTLFHIRVSFQHLKSIRSDLLHLENIEKNNNNGFVINLNVFLVARGLKV
jgi:hypothetical protein